LDISSGVRVLGVEARVEVMGKPSNGEAGGIVSSALILGCCCCLSVGGTLADDDCAVAVVAVVDSLLPCDMGE